MKQKLKFRNSQFFKKVHAWSVPLVDIYRDPTLRLDATHYDRIGPLAIQHLKKLGCKLSPLGELADIKLPGQFKRIWASEAYGYRYVNGTELINMCGLAGNEKDPRFLSKLFTKKVNNLLLREGMLLVTCSGTIGRIIYVSKSMEGWAGTHDLIRVIPKSPEYIGFLYTYLSSPIAQAQIFEHTFGGTIDHITADQLMTILVPVLPDDEVKKIHRETMDALVARENAIVGLLETRKVFQWTPRPVYDY